MDGSPSPATTPPCVSVPFHGLRRGEVPIPPRRHPCPSNPLSARNSPRWLPLIFIHDGTYVPARLRLRHPRHNSILDPTTKSRFLHVAIPVRPTPSLPTTRRTGFLYSFTTERTFPLVSAFAIFVPIRSLDPTTPVQLTSPAIPFPNPSETDQRGRSTFRTDSPLRHHVPLLFHVTTRRSPNAARDPLRPRLRLRQSGFTTVWQVFYFRLPSSSSLRQLHVNTTSPASRRGLSDHLVLIPGRRYSQ